VLDQRLGQGAGASLGLGLFAAGFTSAITAPLAAALAVRSLVGSADDDRWATGSPRFRGVWLGVLLTGMAFGLTGVRPVPVIILAQAFNGLLLPLVALFLWISMNDRGFLGDGGVNSRAQNVVMGAVVLACVALGLRGLGAAVVSAVGFFAKG